MREHNKYKWSFLHFLFSRIPVHTSCVLFDLNICSECFAQKDWKSVQKNVNWMLLLIVWTKFLYLSRDFEKIVCCLQFNLITFYWLKWKLLPRAFQNRTAFSKIQIIAKVIMESYHGKIKILKIRPFFKKNPYFPPCYY